MKQLITELKAVYIALVTGILLFMAIIEYVFLDETGGIFLDNRQFEFIYQTVMILVSLSACYFSLRLFKFKKIQTELSERPLQAYKSWSIFRMVLLEGPAMLNAVGYWFFENSSFEYLWLILLLSFAFLYPTKERFMNETGYFEE